MIMGIWAALKTEEQSNGRAIIQLCNESIARRHANRGL